MSVSVLRSVARYTALALPDFEVRFAPDEQAGFERPWARVSAATPVTSSPHGTTHRDMRMTVSVVCFPVAGMNGESSYVEAARIEQVLTDVITIGIDPAGFGTRSRRGHPMRIPLFDYRELGLFDPATEAERVGWLRVLDAPGTSTFADPNSDTAWIATADLRVGWSEGILRDPDWPTVERVTGRARP